MEIKVYVVVKCIFAS